MAATVLLINVVNEVDGCPRECQAFLNRMTGECFTAMEEELQTIEEECEKSGTWNDEDESDRKEEESRMPAWQRESLAKAREVLTSDDWIDLPTMFDFDEYRVMEDFCGTVGNQRVQEDLLRAIRGKGAFRRFKDALHRAGTQEKWYAFRGERLAEFVLNWLDSKGIAYEK